MPKMPQKMTAVQRPCPYCGRKMERGHPKLAPSRDHLVPKSRDGRIIVICCVQCNGIKADLTPGEWHAFIVANPGWWKLSKAELRAARPRHPRPTSSLSLPELVDLFRGRHVPLKERQRRPPPVVVPPELIWSVTPEGRLVEVPNPAHLSSGGEPSPSARSETEPQA
jgi:hypothetical protein